MPARSPAARRSAGRAPHRPHWRHEPGGHRVLDGLGERGERLLVVLTLGLADRLGGFEQIPDQLARRDVLVAAGLLFAIELVVDKIPYLDSTWDVVSTVLRPTVGAALGVLMAGDAGASEAVYGTISGGSALASHLVKAGTRLAVNASPEPFTNIGVSVGEDVTVLGVVALLLANPWLAFTLTAVLLVAGIAMLVLLARLVRRGRARWRRSRATPDASAS